MAIRIILALLMALVASWLWQAAPLAPGSYTLPLPARCELWVIAPPIQPARTLALACPRADLMRLWPLPVQSPWFEDPSIPAGPSAQQPQACSATSLSYFYENPTHPGGPL